MDDEWELRLVRVPKGTHRSKSRDTRGADRDLLREDGTNKLLGPTESIAADDLDEPRTYEEPTSGQTSAKSESAVAEVVGEIIQNVADQIDWDVVMEQLVMPAVRRARGKVAQRFRSAIGRADPAAATTTEVAVADLPPESPATVVSTADEGGVVMTAEEYSDRVASVLAADSFAAWQRKLLSTARVEAGDLHPELQCAMTALLQGDTSSLSEAELGAVMTFLQRSSIGRAVAAVPIAGYFKELPLSVDVSAGRPSERRLHSEATTSGNSMDE